jgi:hypothetical protein
MTEKHVLYEQRRDRALARDPITLPSPAMVLTPQGLMLGAGTILVGPKESASCKA